MDERFHQARRRDYDKRLSCQKWIARNLDSESRVGQRPGTRYGRWKLARSHLVSLGSYPLRYPNPVKSSAMKIGSSPTGNKRFMARHGADPIFMYGGAPTVHEVLSECGPEPFPFGSKVIFAREWRPFSCLDWAKLPWDDCTLGAELGATNEGRMPPICVQATPPCALSHIL